jgi:hypothetical protein
MAKKREKENLEANLVILVKIIETIEEFLKK